MSQWDRILPKGKRKGETPYEFAAFQGYLKLGPERSIAKAAAEHAKKSGKSLSTVKYWEQLSVKWNWVARCAAYDDSVVVAERQALEKERLTALKKIMRFKLGHIDRLIAATEGMYEDVSALRKAPKVTVEQMRPDGTINKVTAARQADIAILNREMRETAREIDKVLPAPPAPAPDKTKASPKAVGGTFSFVKPRPKAHRERKDS